ncbi:DUF6054 family protein [Listeria booriae]|uniref:Uncharacterized protein n=1 Tax=Listeria booriae TaxID=1552123 RepID=A0A7X0YQD3_9LIST|nr:DUF6054 family protein [Listeria booriae]MBC1336406.1 hypothetical protein [Listeria booriae]MBC1564188.1 hypothetical protein [Listeria booriae]MBC1796210.1 hypothetical protein [Listeria booriae]MBC2035534.1 hypothetical protein [Listeria booriae]MBC2146676.1 hypothetical protein [Listeria booriae]
MAQSRYVVQGNVAETMDLIKFSQSSNELVFEELRQFGDFSQGMLTYERANFHASSPAALFIVVHDFNHVTEVTMISIDGSSNTLLNKLDWGAKSFIGGVKSALKPVLIEEVKLPD